MLTHPELRAVSGPSLGAEEPGALVATGRPHAIAYSGDWPPEQAPRGLFTRYEVKGVVREVVPRLLFLRQDDGSDEFIHGHYKRAHAGRANERWVAAVRIEFEEATDKEAERTERRMLQRLRDHQARIEGHGGRDELWLYLPQARLDAHDPFGETVADALVEGVTITASCAVATAPFITTVDFKRAPPEGLAAAPAPAPAAASDSEDSASYVQPSPRDLSLPSYMSGTITKNSVDMY